jgi:hypothetical protein
MAQDRGDEKDWWVVGKHTPRGFSVLNYTYIRRSGGKAPRVLNSAINDGHIQAQPPTRWCPARLIFHREDRGDTFCRNVGSHTD